MLKGIGAYSNLRIFLSDHTGFTSDLPYNPSLLRRGKVLPLYTKGESEGVAHAIAKFQISLASFLRNS